MRTRMPLDVDHARHGADRGVGLLGDALGRAVEQGFHGGARHLQAEEADDHGDADRRGRIAPPEAEAGQDEADDDGERAEHVGGEMQRVGRQRLASGRRALRDRAPARARNSATMSITSTMKGTAEMVGGGRAFAQMAVGLDQNTAGKQIEQGSDAERREALELAVAVVVLLVGRLSDTRTTAQVMMVATRSIVECRASEISASEPMAMPTTSFAAAMPPLTRIEIAATEDLGAGRVRVEGCHGRRFSSPPVNIKRPSTEAIATHSQERVYCELFRLKSRSPDPQVRKATGRANALPMTLRVPTFTSTAR